jgi:hypothetical protein
MNLSNVSVACKLCYFRIQLVNRQLGIPFARYINRQVFHNFFLSLQIIFTYNPHKLEPGTAPALKLQLAFPP